MSSGKGSLRRPRFVPYETYSENYDRIYLKNKQYSMCPVCGAHIDTSEACDRPDCPFQGNTLDDSVYED